MNVAAIPTREVDFASSMFLLVDDKPFFRDMAQTALIRCRARDIKHAVDTDEAVEFLKRYGPRMGAVICDWETPSTGGIELLRKIRTGAVPKTAREMCVVILTGKAEPAAVKAAMLLDVNGFAIAPLSTEKLVKTLQQAVGRSWKLRTEAHYASVPKVDLPSDEKTAVPAAAAAVNARALVGHEDGSRNHAPGAAVPDGPPRPAAKAPELLNVHMCTLDNVQPGVVLARDLKDRDGQLLLKNGTDLSATLLARLKSVAEGHAESYHVWVGERPAVR